MHAFKQVAIALLILGTAATQAQAPQDDSVRIRKISQKIVEINKRLVPSPISVDMNWTENKEVIEIKSWPIMKRIAATRILIWELQKNEEKQFPNAGKNTNELVVTLIGRVVAYNFLKELIRNSADEIGLKDFLDGEIADLHLTLNHKIPYGMYLKLREQREDKQTYLYAPNKEVVTELIKLKREENTTIAMLASKTSAIALMHTCVHNLRLCAGLP